MILSNFLNKLKRLDKSLFLKLDRKRKRYLVYRKDRQNLPREILVIENDGEFCYPNYENIVQLYQMDLWRNPNLIKKMDKHNEGLDKESDEKNHRLSDEISKLITRSVYF